MESVMSTMAPASFYYYNPDPNPETRQHGHFIPHPQQMAMYPVVPSLPSTPVYSRPNSSCSQQQMPLKSLTSVPSNIMTPLPSPPAPAATTVASNAHLSQPIAQKPMIMLETTDYFDDSLRYPSTPPLSTTSSTIGSPGSCDMLATPLNPMFSGLESCEGLKENCVSDVVPEKFLSGWSNCSSPPMTPVYVQPQNVNVAPKQMTATISGDLLSVSACPSLSPSPSPFPRSSVSEQGNDFCDPRNLTVAGVDGAMSPEFSVLSSTLPVEDEFVKTEALNEVAPDFEQSLGSSLLEDFPELENDDDFVSGLVNLTGVPSPVSVGNSSDADSRSRAYSSASSHSEFECGEFFNTWEMASENEPSSKRQRTASGSVPVLNTAPAEATASDKADKPANVVEDRTNVSDNSSNASTTTSATGSPANSVGNDMPVMPAPTNRRGRKQSLTEDPSKIFACDLCNRRFRRQEHLKRHYRSLHTQEKPFSCHECGKKFSRSDNLAQHARTHGAGAFVMNLYEDPEIVAAATGGYPTHAMYAPHAAMPMGEDFTAMGRVLFQVAADLPGSSSDSSEDVSDPQGKKKRKRSD